MTKPLLYADNISSATWRVRIALYYKDIPHDVKYVPLLKGETRTEEFLTKVNPAGQVPALQVGNTIITESVAIMEYLEEAYPQKSLFPKDLVQRAKARQVAEMINSFIQPLQNPGIARYHSDDPQEQKAWIDHYLHEGFAALETTLKETSADGRFCVGDSLTTADCCFVPQVSNGLDLFKIDMSKYTQILKIYNALMEIDEVKRGHPDNPL